MHQPRRSSILFFVCALILSSAFVAKAQETAQTTGKASYEIVLHLLKTSSADDKKTELPAALVPVLRKLKADYGQAAYNLALTLLNRVSEKGNLEIKGISPLVYEQQAEEKSLSFYDLKLYGLKQPQNQPNELQIDSLHFGIRVPYPTLRFVQEGKNIPQINYENLGITVRPLSLTFDEPTVIGTMTTARPNEMLILVMTLKPDSPTAARAARKN